jgi:hypothetical protein
MCILVFSIINTESLHYSTNGTDNFHDESQGLYALLDKILPKAIILNIWGNDLKYENKAFLNRKILKRGAKMCILLDAFKKGD